MIVDSRKKKIFGAPKNLFVDTGMDKTFKNVNSFKIFSEKIVQKNGLNGLDQAIDIQLRTKECICRYRYG